MKVPSQFLLICIASFVIGNSVSACEVEADADQLDLYIKQLDADFLNLCIEQLDLYAVIFDRLDWDFNERMTIKMEQMSPSEVETMEAFLSGDSELAAYNQRIQSALTDVADFARSFEERVASSDVSLNDNHIAMNQVSNFISEVIVMQRFILTKADEILAATTTPYASITVASSKFSNLTGAVSE